MPIYLGTSTTNIVDFYIWEHSAYIAKVYIGSTLYWQKSTPTLSVGDAYQGGVIGYIFQSGDPGYISGETHGIIAQSSDLSSSAPWGDVEIAGADATSLGSGTTNTSDIITDNTDLTISARLCYDSTINSYTDWCLPSQDDLYKLYLNRVAIGGFTTNEYWSSSESTFGRAITIGFTDGVSQLRFKYRTDIYTRAIRYF